LFGEFQQANLYLQKLKQKHMIRCRGYKWKYRRSGGGLDVGWIDNGDWLDYNVNAALAGVIYREFQGSYTEYGSKTADKKVRRHCACYGKYSQDRRLSNMGYCKHYHIHSGRTANVKNYFNHCPGMEF
jgi:hypothetical protein